MSSVFLNYYGYNSINPTATASSYKTTYEINRSPYIFSSNTFSTVTGGSIPYTYLIQSGSIPAGTTLLPTSSYKFNNASYITSSASNSNLVMNQVSFTTEFWVNVSDFAASQGGCVTLTNTSSAGSDGSSIYIDGNAGKISFFITGNSPSYSSATGVISLNTWYHVALVFTRTGTGTNYSGVAVLYVNGTAVITTGTVTPNFGSSIFAGLGRVYNDLPTTGTLTDTTTLLSGHLSNVRIVKGQALYTGNFTAPSTPIPLTKTSVGFSGTNIASSITGTVVLLTAQSPTFIDSSNNPAAITLNNYGGVITENGVIFGSPTAAQVNTAVSIAVQDARGISATTISSANYFSVNTEILATATTTTQSYTVGTAITSYNPLTLTGGTGVGPFTYATSVSLNSGLTYNATSGLLSGTPVATGLAVATYNPTFTVTDSLGFTATTTSSVTINVAAIAPQGVAAILTPTIDADNVSVDVNFTSSSTAIGTTLYDPVTVYTAYVYIAGVLQPSLTSTLSIGLPGNSTNAFVTVTGLTPGTAYTFKVSATSVGGESVLSSMSSAITITASSSYIGAINYGGTMSLITCTCVDSAGNQYLGGVIGRGVNNTAFVAKINNYGAVQWIYGIPAPSSTTIIFIDSMCVDTSNNLYVAGRQGFTSSSFGYLWVAKLPTNFTGAATYTWQRTINVAGGTSNDTSTLYANGVKIGIDSSSTYLTIGIQGYGGAILIGRLNASNGLNAISGSFGYQLENATLWPTISLSLGNLLVSTYSTTLDNIYFTVYGSHKISGSTYSNVTSVVRLLPGGAILGLASGAPSTYYKSGSISTQYRGYGITQNPSGGNIFINGFNTSTTGSWQLGLSYPLGFIFDRVYGNANIQNINATIAGGNLYTAGYNNTSTSGSFFSQQWSLAGTLYQDDNWTGSNWVKNTSLPQSPIFTGITSDSTYLYYGGHFDYSAAANYSHGFFAKIPFSSTGFQKAGTYSPSSSIFGTTGTTVTSTVTSTSAGSTTGGTLSVFSGTTLVSSSGTNSALSLSWATLTSSYITTFTI